VPSGVAQPAAISAPDFGKRAQFIVLGAGESAIDLAIPFSGETMGPSEGGGYDSIDNTGH